MPTRMRFGFIGLVMSLLMIGYGCGGSGGNTNGQENSSPPDGDIANNREAAEALMGMADAEMYAYASLLEMFSDGGTKPLFDSSVDLTDADYETLMDLSDRIEAAVPAYEAAGVFLTQHSTPNSRVRYVQGHPRLPQGVIGAIGDFVSWMRGATGERRRNDILQIAAQLSEAERQQMYQSAQDSLPGQDIGGNANEFFEKLTNGDLDHSAARLHNDYVHNIDIPAYGNKAQDLSARPIDIAAREGAKGVEAGAQVIAEGSKAIICAKFPQFCEGVDKAQEIVDKLNEIGEDPVGAAGDTVKDQIKERAQEWLQERLGESLGIEIDFDQLAEEYENFSGLVEDAESLAGGLDEDFGGLGALFSDDGDGTTAEDIEALVLEGEGDGPIVVAVPDSDNDTIDIVVPDGDYDVTALGTNDELQNTTVTAPPGNSTVVLVDLENQGDTSGFNLSLSASPADPGPLMGVSVTGRISPATAGVEITFSIVGTDGYGNTETIPTDETGVAMFYIPGGAEGVVDTVTATIVTTGLTQSFTYEF